MSWVNKIQEALNYIEKNLKEDINITKVSKAINYSPSAIQQLFSAITGYSIAGYIRSRRLTLAAKDLIELKTTVTDTAFNYGYSTVESFSKAFKRFHGCNPSIMVKNPQNFKQFDPIHITFSIKGGFNMSNNIIPSIILGLQPVTWTDVTRQNEFVWSVVSALQKLGDHYSYDYVAAVSGSAFRAAMNENQLNHGNYHVINNLEIVNHTFNMLGYDIAIYEISDFETDSNRIMQSIDKGIPVLTIEGVINCSDCCIIAGYNDNGRVLLGFNPFMNVKEDHDEPHDDTGYFRKTNWHSGYIKENNGKYVIINKKIEKPNLQDIYKKTLLLAYNLIRGTKHSDQIDGYAAHTLYAKRLQEDVTDSFDLYLHILCNLKLYIDKQYAIKFLKDGITVLPSYKKELNNIASCYEKIYYLRKDLANIIKEQFNEEGMQSVNSPEVRKKYADTILEIRDLECEAANYIECIINFKTT